MLKIIVKGEPLDLNTDMTFEYRIKNPFFEDKIIPVPATYSFAVPLTPRNNRLLAYPLRLNQIKQTHELEAKIVFGSIVIAEGFLVRKKTTENKSVNLFFKAQSDENLLDKPLCELPLKEYDLSSGDYLENLHNLCERSFEKKEPFALPMMRIAPPSKRVALWGMDKCDFEGIHKILKFLGKRHHKVVDPNDVYINAFSLFSQAITEGNKFYTVKRDGKLFDCISPFPYLWHIVEVILASLNIAENPFKDGGTLENIVVSATYAPLDSEIFESTPFKLNKSLSSCNTGEFIKEVFKAFGFSLNRLRGKTQIISYGEMLKQLPIGDWSNILLNGWSIDNATQESLITGVESERPTYKQEDGEKRVLRVVNSPYQVMYQLYLMAHNIDVDGVEYKRKDIATSVWYVTLTSEYYYSYFDEDTRDYWVEYKGVKSLASVKTENTRFKKRNRKANLTVPSMIIDFAGVLFKPDYTRMPTNGTYYGEFRPYIDGDGFTHRYTYLPFIHSERNKKDFTPALLSYVGRESSYIPVPINKNNVAPHPRYPFATTNGFGVFEANGFNFENTKDFSLVAKAFFEKKRHVLKGKVVLTEKQIKELTGVDVVICKGKRWLLKEISIPIKPHKIYPAQVTLVEIPELDNLSFPDFNTWA